MYRRSFLRVYHCRRLLLRQLCGGLDCRWVEIPVDVPFDRHKEPRQVRCRINIKRLVELRALHARLRQALRLYSSWDVIVLRSVFTRNPGKGIADSCGRVLLLRRPTVAAAIGIDGRFARLCTNFRGRFTGDSLICTLLLYGRHTVLCRLHSHSCARFTAGRFTHRGRRLDTRTGRLNSLLKPFGADTHTPGAFDTLRWCRRSKTLLDHRTCRYIYQL
jgi:hypothetical protein